jgi:hypothetical protein
MRPRAISKAQPDEFPMNSEGGVHLFGKPKLVASKTFVHGNSEKAPKILELEHRLSVKNPSQTPWQTQGVLVHLYYE